MAKRIFACALVLCLALSLAVMAGCGKTGSDAKKGGNSNSMDAEDMIFYDIPEELKGTTVQFATWIDHTKTESAKVMADFEQLTDIKVELVNVPQSQYTIKVASLIAADQAPDMLVKNEYFAQTFQIAMPVEEVNCINVEDEFWNKDIIKYGELNGKHYLLAGSNDVWSIPGGCVYYNKSIFAENGLKTPSEYVEENNWNLNTFYTCLQQCRKIIPSTEASAWYVPDVMNAMFGAPLIEYDSDSGKFINNIKTTQKDNLLKCWQTITKWREEGLLSTTFSGDTNQFVTGKCAMVVSGTYGLRLHGWFTAMDIDDVGFTYLPKINADDENYPATTGIRAYAVCKGSSNPEAAGYFIRYYCNANHYDLSDVYKNKEAQQFVDDLKKIATNDGLGCEYSVASTMLDNPNHLTKPLYESNSAQLNTNFNSLSNTIDGCIEKANALLATVAAENG